MNYEQFLANAECALNDCREMKETLSAVQAALSAVPDISRSLSAWQTSSTRELTRAKPRWHLNATKRHCLRAAASSTASGACSI